MEPFTTHTGRAVPLRRTNVDTDQIIPAEYLKRVSRAGFGEGLFAAWREDPSFVLNQPQYDGATILVAGRLRHRLVPRARRLGPDRLRLPRRDRPPVRRHLPHQRHQGRPAAGILPEATVAALQDAAEADPGTEVTVDLGARVVLADAAGIKASFDLDDYTRWRLMEGLDDIGLTLRHVDEITSFEHSRPSWLPVTA